MRIVSLSPAATEWVAAFGAGADLVGRSHACDHPPSVRRLPVLTRSRLAPATDAAAIDRDVRARAARGSGWYAIDLDALRALRPDVILAPEQGIADVEAACATWAEAPPHLFTMAPRTFKQVLDAALRLGRVLDRTGAAMAAVGEGERRLRALQDWLGRGRRGDPRDGPTVASLEWLAPLMSAGCWLPDLVAFAGGRAVLAEAGTPSPEISWEALRAADPDVIALLPCGFSLADTRRNLHHLAEQPAWSALRAVREGRVYLFEGRAYFNRPGPRLYRAVELMAAVLHPVHAPAIAPASWECAPLNG